MIMFLIFLMFWCLLVLVCLFVLVLFVCVSIGQYWVDLSVVLVSYGCGDVVCNVLVQVVVVLLAEVGVDVCYDVWWIGFGDLQLDVVIVCVLVVNIDLVFVGLVVQCVCLQVGLVDNVLWL